MTYEMHSVLRKGIDWLGYLPIRIRQGSAKGCWWSLYPFSGYWRSGANNLAVESFLLEHVEKSDAVCWDIGAHFGIYSITMANIVTSKGAVHSFEPDPVAFSRLQWHRRLNKSHYWYIHPVAVSDKSGYSHLLQYDNFGSPTSHLSFEGESGEGAKAIKIKTVALDQWVKEGKIPKPGFIKIDAEGHGHKALQGFYKTLVSHRPTLQFATHDQTEYDGFMGLLKPQNYRIVTLTKPSETNPYFLEMGAVPK